MSSLSPQLRERLHPLIRELRSHVLRLDIDDREQLLSRLSNILAQLDGRTNRVTSPTQLQREYNSVPPASKKAILALPIVKISEENKGECSICLIEYGKGEEVKEMPCKHKFHSGCIEKWLGIHRTCPFCRYKMPVVDNNAD